MSNSLLRIPGERSASSRDGVGEERSKEEIRRGGERAKGRSKPLQGENEEGEGGDRAKRARSLSLVWKNAEEATKTGFRFSS